VARFAAPGNDKLPTQFTRLRVERVTGKLVAYSTLAPLASQPLLASGTIRSTLFAATDEAGIPDAIATQLAEIFATDIDFRRELKKGATFSLVYESLTADGEPVTWGSGSGRVLAAEFVNKNQTYSAMWFKDGEGKGSYFGLDGQSKQRSLLSSPLEFSRVTSGFAMRMHPILNTWKQHNGVDYGAPSGTPVRTIGDGVVEFAGWQNGYGNVVHIKHNGDLTDGLRPPQPGRHRQGRQGRAGRHDRCRRPDRLGDRAAPALRGEGRWRPAGSAARRAIVRRRRPDAGGQGPARAAVAERPGPAWRRPDAGARASPRRVSRRCGEPAGPPQGRIPEGAARRFRVSSVFIGLMSGTSLDGIDGVLVEFSPEAPLRLQVRAHRHAGFPAELQAELLALNQAGGNESIASPSPEIGWRGRTPGSSPPCSTAPTSRRAR
jgi:hypothetical protein